MKKYFLVATFVVVFVCFLGVNAPNVKAATIEELQTQIQALLAQIAELQRQLAQLQGTALSSQNGLVAYYKFEGNAQDSIGRNHGTPTDISRLKDAGKGWIVVQASSLTRANIIQAIKNGSFYASQGPTFTNISFQNGNFSVVCPEARSINFVGSAQAILRTVNVQSATYTITNEAFVRAECVDSSGKKAWTNPIMNIGGQIKNPYAAAGNWYRGNTHTHSNKSDGNMSPADVISQYKELSYQFLALTDHNKFTAVDQYNQDGIFITLPAAECGGNTIEEPHLTVIGEGLSCPSGSLQKRIDKVVSAGGIVFINHPQSSGLSMNTIASLTNYHGIEIYNAHGDRYGLEHWDVALSNGQFIGGIASDDAHQLAVLGDLPLWENNCQSGSCIQFEDSGDTVSLPNIVINGLTSITLETWVKTSDTNAAIISGAKSNNSANEYRFYIPSADKISIYIKESSATFKAPGLTNGSWHHLIWTRDGSGGQNNVYMDGILLGSAKLPKGSLVIAANGLWLGQEQDKIGGDWDSNQAFIGYLDEMKIWNKVLSSDEVKSEYSLFVLAPTPTPITPVPTPTPTTTPSITVLSPNGGEVYRIGDTVRIKWQSSGIKNVSIYIFDNRISGSGSTNYVSFPSQDSLNVAAERGYYDWTINRGIPNISAVDREEGNNYRISIISSEASDTSDAPFSIVAAAQNLPDLTISNLYAEGNLVNQKIRINFTIKNIGNASAYPINWSGKHQPDGTSSRAAVNTCKGATLEPNGSCQVAYDITFPTTGSKSIQVSVDQTNAVAESNETNNNEILNLTIVSGLGLENIQIQLASIGEAVAKLIEELKKIGQ